MENEIQIHKPAPGNVSVFSDMEVFGNAQRMATALAASSVVPAEYQNNVANTLVALEMAQRMGESPLMVMQNLDIIHGKPGFNSKFVIARINTSGLFAERLKFDMQGEGANLECTAWTRDKHGEIIKGAKATMKMAVAEGWTTKKGSKWATMPELMIQYRSAAFFCRLHAPELLMGMRTTEENIEISIVDDKPPRKSATDLNQAINEATTTSEEPKADPIIEEAEIVEDSDEELI